MKRKKYMKRGEEEGIHSILCKEKKKEQRERKGERTSLYAILQKMNDNRKLQKKIFEIVERKFLIYLIHIVQLSITCEIVTFY
jgi:hypothetical protein